MRSPLSLFVLVLFSSGVFAVNCDYSSDDSSDDNDNEWKSVFFWITPEMFGPNQRQRVTQYDSDSSAHDTVHSEEKTFSPYPPNDFDLPLYPFVVFPKFGSTVVSPHAISSSSSSGDGDKDDMDSKRAISPKVLKLTEKILEEDVVVPKTENTVTKSIVPSDCKEKESEIEEFILDYDILSRLLDVLSSCDEFQDSIANEKKEERVADPDIKCFENFYGYSNRGKDSEKPSLCEKSTVKEDIAADLSDKLPVKKNLNPSKSDADVSIGSDSSIDSVPLTEVVGQREAIRIPRKESNVADERPPKATAVDESEQHDATNDNKNAKKDYQMPRLTLRNFFKRFLL